jgi:prolyl 4-hydroxylase
MPTGGGKGAGDGEGWCEFVECADEEGGGGSGGGRDSSREGVTFRPVRGNALYWENLRLDGEGYQETWHAGLPVRMGTKVGLNIWTWQLF